MESKDIEQVQKREKRTFSNQSDSVVCIIPGKQGYQLSQKTPRCASHCGVKLRSVLPTTESSSVVCITLRSQTLQCASYLGVKLRGVHHTMESSSAVCITPQSLTKSKSLGVSGCL